jgi:ribosomal protein S12 methylthiotransferase accessory factor
MLERIRPALPLAGITRLADITGLDRLGVPVTLALRPNSPTIVCSSGKGLTLEAALVSGAMEALEIHHAEQVALPRLRAAHRELGGAIAAVPIDRLALTRHSLFRVDRPIDWTLGWDLARGCETAVPASVVGFTLGPAGGLDLMPFQSSTNGLASGENLLEALCHALLEVIERDALTCHDAITEEREYLPPRVRPETIEHPLVRELVGRLEQAEVEVILLDATVDTCVPAYSVLLADTAERGQGIFAGSGAHLDPEVAMLRAITEAAQARTVSISGSRDDLFRQRRLRIRRNDTDESRRLLRALPAVVDARERRSLATATFEGDVHVILSHLARIGMDQVIVFDLSRPVFPIRVVKVVVPGLEGPSMRCAPMGPRARAFARSFG